MKSTKILFSLFILVGVLFGITVYARQSFRMNKWVSGQGIVPMTDAEIKENQTRTSKALKAGEMTDNDVLDKAFLQAVKDASAANQLNDK